MLRCGIAPRFPYNNVAAASTSNRTAQVLSIGINPAYNTRNNNANPAALLPTARNAVTGVGAPW